MSEQLDITYKTRITTLAKYRDAQIYELITHA